MSTTSTTTGSVVLGWEIWTPAGAAWALAESSHVDEALTPIERPGTLVATVATDRTPSIVKHPSAEECGRESGESITAVLTVPFVDDGVCTAVVQVILSGSGAGGVELWGGPRGDHALRLQDSLHPGREDFTIMSGYVAFPLGSGLPGLAWERGCAQFCADLGASTSFLRSSSAVRHGYHAGLSLPLIDGKDLASVLVLLGTEAKPIWQHAEIWLPEDDHLVLADNGGAIDATALTAKAGQPRVGEDLVGAVWAARRPMLLTAITNENFVRHAEVTAAGIRTVLAWPTCVGGSLRSVTLLMW